jgi:hypothetical protein
MGNMQGNIFSAIAGGEVSFAYGVSPWVFAGLAISVTFIVWFAYGATTRSLSSAWRTGLTVLRSGILLLLGFLLLRPVVNTMELAQQETYLAVLVDDSRSMDIRDMPDGTSRHGALQIFFSDETGILGDLEEDFQTRIFGFDRSAKRISNLEELDQAGEETSIGEALNDVALQLGGLPLAGVVLISDGNDNSGIDPVIAARDLGARGIPVFSIGVGEQVLPRDIGLVDVKVSRTVLENSVFRVQIGLHQTGFDGESADITIRDNGEPVASKTVTLASNSIQQLELELSPDRDERIVYDLDISLKPGEIIERNNTYQFLVDNRPKESLDVLYLEGHPRNEYKFIRRAIEGDLSLRLATYLRTGPEKFYRQGVESPTELSEGFPPTQEDLFEYEAIILGDIEAEFFTAEQLEMLESFVSKRGGGLLTSGRIDEGFIGTPLADLLPVSLVEEKFLPPSLQGGLRRGDHATGGLFTPRLTSIGQRSPLMRLSVDREANRAAWAGLPELQGVSVTGRIKSGASVLLEHPYLEYQNQPLPLLLSQRYGSGRAVALNTASTWRWQMMLPSTDQSQETLWRQILRWLAASAPTRITIDFDREYYNVGEKVGVSATILNADYQPSNDSSPWLQVTDPLQQVFDEPLEWDIEEDGVYRSEFIAELPGVYELFVDVPSAAGEASRTGAEQSTAMVVTPSLREYINAQGDWDVLKRISSESRGAFFPLSDISQLQEVIRQTPNALMKERTIDLWNNKWVFILLVFLMSLDWFLRRRKGLS